VKQKGFKRRYIFEGWNNYTEFELKVLQQVKDELKSKHGIDLDKPKDYGPRDESSMCKRGTMDIVSGRDFDLRDSELIRFCVCRQFKLDNIIPDLLYHLEWRQTNVPIPQMTDPVLKLVGSGLFYIHGRTKDMQPILAMDVGMMRELI